MLVIFKLSASAHHLRHRHDARLCCDPANIYIYTTEMILGSTLSLCSKHCARDCPYKVPVGTSLHCCRYTQQGSMVSPAHGQRLLLEGVLHGECQAPLQ